MIIFYRKEFCSECIFGLVLVSAAVVGIGAVGEDRVEHDVQGVIDHSGKQFPEQLVGFLQAGVRIHFNQVSVEVLVHNEIVTEQLECVFLLADLALNGLEGLNDHFLDVLLVLAFEAFLVTPLGLRLPSDVLEQGVHRHDVSLFVLLVVRTNFLHCVVCQLHVDLVFFRKLRVVINILPGTCSNVALSVDVDLTVGRIEEYPLSDVELPIEIKHWPLDKLLDHKCKVLHLVAFLVIGIVVGVGL